MSYSIYRRITAKQDLAASWVHLVSVFRAHIYLVILLLVLMLVNWGLEARKWQLLVRPVQRVSLLTGIRAVMSGLSFSIFIPNGVGEYLGRMLYLNEGKRLSSLSVSFVCSLSQVLITLMAGVSGVFYLLHFVPEVRQQVTGISWFWVLCFLYVIAGVIILLTLMYFKISWFVRWIEKIPFAHRHRLFMHALESYNGRLLLNVLFFAFIRYLVFIAQYLLVFALLGIPIDPLGASMATAVLFLVLLLIPTIPVAEVGIRGEISLTLFGLFTADSLGIVSCAVVIWLVNLIVPAILGCFFILGIKLFKYK